MKTDLKVILCDIDTIHPYPGNPRKTAAAVLPVAESIRQFGFRQPIVVDADRVIVAGHVRYQAAFTLGLQKIPVHIAADLTPAQARAYRLADNKTGEYAEWDCDLLEKELASLRTDGYDLDALGLDFSGLSAALDKMEADLAPPAPPDFAPVDASTQPRLDQKKPVTCPECGHVFVPA